MHDLTPRVEGELEWSSGKSPELQELKGVNFPENSFQFVYKKWLKFHLQEKSYY